MFEHLFHCHFDATLTHSRFCPFVPDDIVSCNRYVRTLHYPSLANTPLKSPSHFFLSKTSARSYFGTMFICASTVFVVTAVTPLFLLGLVPIFLFYYHQQRFFATSYRELKRVSIFFIVLLNLLLSVNPLDNTNVLSLVP